MTKQPQLASEDGWVMIPVVILVVVAIGMGLALLNVVDQQTGQTRVQRNSDAAQTLAEGAVSATSNVLASEQTSTMWPTSGACRTVSGDLTTPSTAASSSFTYKVTSEVQARFSGTSPDYAVVTGRNTTWRIDVCPVQGSESRWDDTFLTRSTPAPATTPAQVSLWVRGQAAVRASTAATLPENAKAVVSKVRQSATTFAPPQGFAVGTGVFSTDVGTTVNTALSNGLLGQTLGTNPVIAATSSKIGVRCGLLVTLTNPGSTCLAGALAGVAGATNAAGVGTLNSVLGIDRTQSLGTWTMAPADAIEAWRTEAQQSGVYIPASSAVSGYGDDQSKSVSGDVAGTAHPCFSGSDATKVVFIEKVGNGEQYCNVSSTSALKILIVERGAVRITGNFTGVVYALNKQECTGAGGACTTADRTNATPREVVRIDGPGGHVNGSVWADGAGGAVGIYPGLNQSAVSPTSLINSVGPAANGVCGVSGVDALVTTLNSTLTSLLSSVTGLLSLEEVRYPDGTTTQPAGCALLKSNLSSLSSTQLIDLYGTGGSRTVVTTIHRTRTSILSPWSAWSTKTTAAVALPSLLTTSLPSVVSQVSGLIGATIGSWTAITYDGATVARATANVPQGASPIVGTYRNILPQ